MKLIKESVYVFKKEAGTIGCSPFKIEQTDWDKIIEFNDVNKFTMYHEQRPIDYTWGLAEIKKWVETQQSIEKIKILDIGSGVSMWPSYLKCQLPSSYVEIVDLDAEQNYQNRDNAAIPSFFEKLSKELQIDKISVSGYSPKEYLHNSFDIVTSMSAIEHFDNAMELIQETSSIIKQGGIFVMTTDIMDLDTKKKGFIDVHELNSSLKLSQEDSDYIINFIENKNFTKNSPLFLFMVYTNG